MIDQKYIKNIKGKDFVLFEGLLDNFHSNGGNLIKTSIESSNPLIFKAEVKGTKGEYSAHGDASKENVNEMVSNHIIRMAETRAIARALRLYCNIGMCSAEEITYEEDTKEEKINCEVCNTIISDKVARYSIKEYGKRLCIPCQNKQNANNHL